MSERIDIAAIEARMLSGEPFTYGGMCARFDVGDRGRTTDKTIQRLRRRGLISYRRIPGQGVVWATVEKETAQ